jgi:hypothetical protein
MKTRIFHLLIGPVIAILAVSCVNSQRKQIEADFSKVDQFALNHEFRSAIQLLDTMMTRYKSDYGVVGEALKRKKSIGTGYYREQIASAEGAIRTLQARAAELSSGFILTPGEAGMPGTYEHKRQTAQSSWNRTYLKINLNEKGDIWLTSHYYGTAWIDHVSLRVYDNVNYVLSDTIPLGDPWNRKVEDLGDKWETIDFREGTDAGIIAFIADNYTRSIKVRFNGKKFQYIVLEDYDKRAIRDGWQLAQVLKEMDGLRQSMNLYSAELAKLGPEAGTEN